MPDCLIIGREKFSWSLSQINSAKRFWPSFGPLTLRWKPIAFCHRLKIPFWTTLIASRLWGIIMQPSDRIGRRLSLRDLNLLLVVIEKRSMSKAAAELAVSQPVVSKAIANMERVLGVPLLDRSPTGIE